MTAVPPKGDPLEQELLDARVDAAATARRRGRYRRGLCAMQLKAARCRLRLQKQHLNAQTLGHGLCRERPGTLVSLLADPKKAPLVSAWRDEARAEAPAAMALEASNANFGDPFESITPQKVVRLRRAAAAFLAAHEQTVKQVRFDSAAVLGVRLEVRCGVA